MHVRVATVHWFAWLLRPALLGACALAGCCTKQKDVSDSLMRQPLALGVAQAYRVGSPDVLTITVAGHPELSGNRAVEVNGCIDLGALGGVRVEGLTLAEIRDRIARVAETPHTDISVEITHFDSQRVYLFGQVTGEQRAVAYQGPETVTDLLRRVGGITPDGAPDLVRVVRQADRASAEPQVFQVDLQAILLKGDQSTNVQVMPFDQIYVPETRACRIGKCLHPLLRPVGRALTGGS